MAGLTSEGQRVRKSAPSMSSCSAGVAAGEPPTRETGEPVIVTPPPISSRRIGATDTFSTYVRDGANVDQMVTFFALSNLIFVFAIGFFSGLRRVTDRSDLSDWARGVVSVGSARFLAGSCCPRRCPPALP